MKPKVYEYEKCSTCRKALKWLDARKIAYERVPIVDQPPSREELERMLSLVGDVRKLFNASGLVYRELKVGEKLKTMSVQEALDLLQGRGKLIKRPFVLVKNHGLVGFNEEAWKAVFG